MGKAHRVICPHCKSEKVVQNGHPHRGKLQYFCHTCHKYFSEDVVKGYPPTNIPFPIIAYLLYFHKKLPDFSNMRKFRKFSSQWLECLGIKKEDISRQILHHWINHYEKNIEEIISFTEARNYCKTILTHSIRSIPEEVVKSKILSHRDALNILEDSIGRQFCFDLIRKDEAFFAELLDITSKCGIYCRILIEKELFERDKRLLLTRYEKLKRLI